MIDKLKRIVEKLLITFDFKHFYFNLLYFLLFLLVSGFVHPAHKNILVILAASILFYKLLFLWAYNGESLRNIKILKKYKEFFALLVVVFFFFDFNYFIYDFGIFHTTIYIILFVVLFFIGAKEDSVKTTTEKTIN